MSGASGPNRVHRLAVVAALVALVAGATVFDRPSTDRRPTKIPDAVDVAQVGAAAFEAPSAARRDRSMPVSAPLGVASTTWFCGGAPSGDTTLVLTNRSASPRTAVVTAVTSGSRRAIRRVSVPRYSSRNVAAGFAGRGTLAATIESRHGGLVATQRVTGPGTVTTAACATSSSDQWFFAGGDTQRGSTETLALFNPFDDLATADVTFLTDDGFRRPQPTQGLAVPGRSVVLVDVATVQNRRSDLGAVVTTRAGRIVTWRHQTFDGTGPKLGHGASPEGVSLALGAPTPLTRFAFPTAATGEGVEPRIVIANPGVTASKVRLSFAVDDPVGTGQPPERTVELMAGAVSVLTGQDLRQVAPGVAFTVTGKVISGGAVVGELWFDGTGAALGHGSFATSALGVASREWIAPVGLELPVIDQLGVQSSGASARLALWILTDGVRKRVALAGRAAVVGAAGRVTIDLTALLRQHPGATVGLEASAPVTVSRLQTGPDKRGLVSTPAVPISDRFVSP